MTSKFLALVLRFTPKAERGKVKAVFSLGREMRRVTRESGGPVKDVGVFLDMVELAGSEWYKAAKVLKESM